MFWSKHKAEINTKSQSTLLVNAHELYELTQAIAENNTERLLQLRVSEDHPLYALISAIQKIEKKNKDGSEKALSDINARVERITQISSIRDMIKVVETQTGEVNNMAAQAQEMSASATEISSITNHAAAFVEQSLSSATHGVSNVKRAIHLVDRSFTDFEQTHQQISKVLSNMGEIVQMVNLIEGVADQTNLLALNAAIEAARAGDQGRGFAVVADEVRKLAEDTKSSVSVIKQKMDVLNSEATRTVQGVAKVAQTMQEGKSTMQETEVSIGDILNNTQSIAQEIRQIAVGIEEQSTTLQHFGQSITGFASSAESTLGYARDAGQGIFQISEELIDIRQKRLSQASNLPIQQALAIYKTDHLCWAWKIYNVLLGYDRIDVDQLDSADSCSLGRWLEEFRHTSINTDQLCRCHKTLHQLGRDAITAINHNQRDKIDRIWQELSETMTDLIEEIEKVRSVI